MLSFDCGLVQVQASRAAREMPRTWTRWTRSRGAKGKKEHWGFANHQQAARETFLTHSAIKFWRCREESDMEFTSQTKKRGSTVRMRFSTIIGMTKSQKSRKRKLSWSQGTGTTVRQAVWDRQNKETCQNPTIVSKKTQRPPLHTRF